MKKILITGSSGMLGATLVKLWTKKYQIFATSSSNFENNSALNFLKFDLKEKKYDKLYQWVKPDIIVHCAALVSHEYCQSHPKEAMLINGESVNKLIKIFPKSKLIFISTDAVFPLNTHLANEKTKTGSITIYGRTKELGEKYILSSNGNSCIVRTTIVGKNLNSHKRSFTERIVDSLKNNQQVTLFENVQFTPITIWDLSKELEWIITNECPNILHVSGSSISDKFTFGYRLAKKLDLKTELLMKGQLNNLKIKRSSDQSLDCSLYQKLSGRTLPDLRKTITSLFNNFK